MNCEHYDEELTAAIDASSERNRALYSCLVFLRGQRRQLLENVTRLDRHMGMLAQHISDDETFTVTGAIAVPRPTLNVANLLLHIILPDTDPDGDRFATDEDVSPNNPAFLRKVIAHRRGLKQATEISKGQHLLQLRQRCIGVVPAPIPSPSFPQTHTTGHMDASTSRRSPTPVAGVSSLPADQRTLLYPNPFPITDDTRSDDSDISDTSGRAGKFPNVSPPATLPAIEHDFLQNSRTPYASPPPLSQSTQTPNAPIVSVWDDEDAEPDDRASPIDLTSNDPIMHTTALLNEVHQELSVLCANWESTVPSTVWTISVRFATLIKLAISLDIVGTEEGLRELRDKTIPAVHQLLTTIGDMIPRGMTLTMEMENSEHPQDPPLGDGIVVDMGSPEGPRIFRWID
ncbi:hypothetical protein Moror_13359 [Moniliophthora roreri MCA 2997]|uniref:Uncharacterized protein n=1 Tax=Moniliophthora roreri (strain MCA 2997) TaxID=1381753 RepID=V2WHP9_MONRO|nr:hypothetical protein Moror_13359 [Moniliophthora roreri MCA 2997]